MKRLLLIVSIFLYISSYGQTRSSTSGFSPRANQTFVVEDGNLSARNSLFTPRFIDTLEAANYIQKDTIGNVIYLTSTHSLWVRTIASGSTKKWTEIGSGSGGTWGSITGTLSNQTDLQNALNLKAPLISPLFTTPRLNSTSTIGYVWTATDGSGNGSFQAIPSDNLIVQNAGSGTQTWFTSGDTLYMKKVKNTAFISASTDTDSSLLIALSATGTPSSSTFLRGDNTWAAPGGVTSVNALTGAITFATGSAGTDLALDITGNTITINIPSAGAVTRGLVTGGAQTLLGAKTFSSQVTGTGGFTTAASVANFTAIGGSTAGTSTVAANLFAGAGGVGARVFQSGGTNWGITAGYSYANMVIAAHNVTEATSGTHNLISALAIRAVAVTPGAAATTNATTLYVEGPPTGITPTNPATSFFVDAGLTRLDEGVLLGAGTTTVAPITLTSGTNLTTAVAGSMEYNGTNLFFTRTGTTRESVITANAVNVVSPTSPNRTITVIIDGVTYYISAKTTND